MNKVKVPSKEWLLVDKEGNAYSAKSGKPYKPQHDKCGYLRISTRYEGYSVKCSVHRAVALAFIPNPENKPTVNHKNGIKDDNRVDNLEWATHSEQQIHAHETGLKPNKVKGNRSHFCEYGEDIAHEVCRLIQDGYRNTDILKLYPEMDVKLPSDIRNGRSWKHISCDYNLQHIRRGRLSEETVRWVCKCMEEGMRNIDILAKASNPALNKSSIGHIRRKSVYKDIISDYNF